MKTLKLTYSGKIFYKMRETHPEYSDAEKAGLQGKEFSFDDTYTFTATVFDDTTAKEVEEDGGYIQKIEEDLKTVAGGGYATDTIKDTRIKIKLLSVNCR